MLRIPALCVPALIPVMVQAAVVNPFTETYAADTAGWRDGLLTSALSYAPAGSHDGSSYASGMFNFVNNVAGDNPALIQGRDEFGFSGGAFVGDWVAAGVTEFSAWVRHDAPEPLTYFVRFSGPANFPGAAAISFVPVMPNTWTQLTIAIDPSNPQFVTFEGTDFSTVFTANAMNGFTGIGHVQIGASVSATLAGVDQAYTFDVDDVAIAPAPGVLALLGLSAAGLRRRR